MTRSGEPPKVTSTVSRGVVTAARRVPVASMPWNPGKMSHASTGESTSTVTVWRVPANAPPAVAGRPMFATEHIVATLSDGPDGGVTTISSGTAGLVSPQTKRPAVS